jgi:maleamate amidohydrolase
VTEHPADPGAVVERIRPAQGDTVLSKTKPSAFVGASLLTMLVYEPVDCGVLMEGTTSGCVHATATGAISIGLSAIVVEDATFDRVALSHAVSLSDLNQKSAEARYSREVVQNFAKLAGGSSDAGT